MVVSVPNPFKLEKDVEIIDNPPTEERLLNVGGLVKAGFGLNCKAPVIVVRLPKPEMVVRIVLSENDKLPPIVAKLPKPEMLDKLELSLMLTFPTIEERLEKDVRLDKEVPVTSLNPLLWSLLPKVLIVVIMLELISVKASTNVV